MAMKRKLLVAATLAWVAPLSAHQGPARDQSTDCPIERARALAPQHGVAEAAPAAVVVQATPATAAVLGLGRSSAFMP